MDKLKKIVSDVVESIDSLEEKLSSLGEKTPGYSFFRDTRKTAQQIITSLREYRKTASETFKKTRKAK